MSTRRAQKARPVRYTGALGAEICRRVAEGEMLKDICEDDGMPRPGSVCRWVHEIPEFRERYEAAREAQCEMLLEEIIEIGDEEPEFHHHVGWARNRIEARKWVMTKLNMRRYGDKTLVAGADGTSPAKLEISWQQPELQSTTGRGGNSSVSTTARSGSPALSLTAVPAKPSPASTISSAPLYDVDWSDLDLPMSLRIADRPKP